MRDLLRSRRADDRERRLALRGTIRRLRDGLSSSDAVAGDLVARIEERTGLAESAKRKILVENAGAPSASLPEPGRGLPAMRDSIPVLPLSDPD
jgi:hypothetical protein